MTNIPVKKKWIDPAMATDEEMNQSSGNDRDRSNHTGTQPASTISDFSAVVLATVLTGISFLTNTPVISTDSVLLALGKIQAQLNALLYGRSYAYAEDTTLRSTTSTTTFVTQVTLTTDALTLGNYELFFDCLWYLSSTNRAINVQVLDGANVLRDISPAVPNVSGVRNENTGLIRLNNISGVKTFTLRFRSVGSTTSSIEFASLKIKRVS